MQQIYTIALIALSGYGLHAQCTGPTLTSANGPATPICSGQSASLTATGNGQTIVWYDVATGGNQAGTGSPFNTGALTATKSFWAEAQSETIMPAQSGGGKPTKNSNGGSSGVVGTAPWGLSFNVTQKFVLNSVDVFLTSGTPGDITVELRDANYGLIESVTVAAPAGGTGANPVQFTVPLGFTIAPGTYRLLAPFGHPAMNRDLSPNTFPYAIGTVGQITGGTINSSPTGNTGVYYFFYNWNYSPIELCKSARQQVQVNVNPIPAQPTATSPQVFDEGNTLANLVVTGTGLAWFSDAAGQNPIPDTTVLQDGVTYYVNQTVDGCTSATRAIVAQAAAGVNDAVFADFKHYPNPVKDNLTISNSTEITMVSIYNMQGRTVLELKPESLTADINLSGLPSGMYLARIHSGEAVRTIQIVKE